jgi:hypothetical protein
MSTLTLGRWYLKCQRKSTIGTWVVKFGQKQVNIVIECPLESHTVPHFKVEVDGKVGC